MNVKNRTLFTGDNLDVMRGMNSGCVALIYLDPPFNSNRTYSAPVGSKAAGAAFKDAWTLDDVDVAWIGLIAEKEPALATVIDAAGIAHSPSMKAYLTMMAVRLLEMKRLLKPTGSIYLHCDPTASHYLKLVMDCVFGRRNFKNELSWKRTNTHNDAKRFPRVSDRLLFYSFRGAPWHTLRLPLKASYVNRYYRHQDSRGRYQRADLTGPGLSDGESGKPWQGYDPGGAGRCWSAPKTGGYAKWIEANLLPGYRLLQGVHERLDALDQAGMIYWTPNGHPRLKRYLAASKGPSVSDFVGDISKVNDWSKEWVGYPTQKPLALLDRIIKSSSDKGDVVLDPFCGCATTCVAAALLGRQWIGIDMASKAHDLVVSRLQDTVRQHETPLYQPGPVIHRTDIPRRTDLGKLPNYRTHRHVLYGQQEGNCAGCCVHFPFRNLTMDHVIPRSKGGADHRENLQLLCGACNSAKGTLEQAAFIAKLKRLGLRSGCK